MVDLEPHEAHVRSYKSNLNLLSSISPQRERILKAKQIELNIMVVGERDLGKATFIRSLFGADYVVLNTSAKPAARGNYIQKTTEIEIHEAHVVENGFEIKLNVIYTPGFGDYTDSTNAWVSAANYIDSQYQYYMCQEEQPDRTRISDSRVHICFYFLPPNNRLSELNLVAMRELGKRVNLIPVIAKADSLTRDDCCMFKRLLRQVIAAETGINAWRLPSALATSGDLQDNWPFAIVSSDHEIVLANGTQSFGRQYQWGVVDINNPDHSDLGVLKKAVFQENLLQLIDATVSKHYTPQRKHWRLFRLCHALRLNKASRASFQLGEENERERYSTCTLESANMGIHNRAASPRSIASDVAEEAALSMSGLDLFLTIANLGYDFLNDERLEQDVLLKQTVLALKNQFNVVAKFQEERFDQQVAELEKKRDALSREISQLSKANMALKTEIQEMERRKRK